MSGPTFENRRLAQVRSEELRAIGVVVTPQELVQLYEWMDEESDAAEQEQKP